MTEQNFEAANLKHTCHHPACDQVIPPRLYACRKHWFMLPAGIKFAITRNYRPGQEIDKNPTREYLNATKVARDFYLSKAPSS